jgi:hypothetical protein
VKVEEPDKKDSSSPSIQPWYVLLFVALVIAFMGVIAFFFPQGGWRPLASLGIDKDSEFTLYFVTWDDLFTPDTTKAKNIDELLADLAAVDTIMAATADTSGQFRKSADLGQQPKAIQYPDNDPSVLFPAFEAMEQSQGSGKPVRVLHFGDSQIEGDRMSSLFRARLQEKFGGSGPGLVSAKPLTSSMSVNVEYSESMQRYAQYGGENKGVKHRRYGAMATFSRFAPMVPDSSFTEAELQTGWVSVSVSRAAYATSKTFNQLKMYYGYNRSEVNVKVFLDDVLFTDESMPAGKGLRVKHWRFDRTPNKIMIIMEGYDSPDIYGLSLEGNGGVALDNVSMRGSSGTSFTALETVPFKPMMDSLNPKLLLLQYGGNTVPYIKDQKAAYGYGSSFKGQLNYLKGLFPGVPMIVIGPSDMSTKVDGKMQTYPNLMHVRDALRNAAFESGAAFFDIYEAMGGMNSMIEWAEADPPLAAADYVHFSPQGARIIAEAFIKSLMADYEGYHRAKVQ